MWNVNPCVEETQKKSEKANYFIKLFVPRFVHTTSEQWRRNNNIWNAGQTPKYERSLPRSNRSLYEPVTWSILELPNKKNNYLFPFRAIESTTSRITLKVKPNSKMTSDNKEMYCNFPPIMLRDDLPVFSNSSFNHNICKTVNSRSFFICFVSK